MRPRRRRAARVRGGSRFAAQDKGSLSLPGRQPAPRLRATERAASEGTACFPPAAPPQELCGPARTPGRAVASAHVVVPGSSRAPASWPSPRCRHSAPEVTARLRPPSRRSRRCPVAKRPVCCRQRPAGATGSVGRVLLSRQPPLASHRGTRGRPADAPGGELGTRTTLPGPAPTRGPHAPTTCRLGPPRDPR